MPDSDLGAVLCLGVRDVGGAVVGHDSFNGDAVGGELGDGPIEERDAGGCFLVGQDLDVGDAVGDVVAGFVETAVLFDVDVDQLAGMAAAIPIRFNTVVTVDNAMSSFSAICGPVMRSQRNCSMSASVSADVCVGDLSAVLANSSTHQLALKRTKTGVTVKIHGSP